MLTTTEKKELDNVVNTSLDRAEQQWNSVMIREDMIKAAAETPTKIPGHKYLGKNKYASDTFIAMMLDMRDSRKHLMQAISARTAKVSQMQRVYYEVTALLPCMATIVEKDRDGSVIEYLGDGLLALFKLPLDDKDKAAAELREISRISRKCLEALKTIVNPIIFNRYSLPPLKIGIGLAFSDALITHFGISANSQVKVIGQCIYYASHLSKGNNEIIVHENLENIWPTSDGGKLAFYRKSFKDVNGYIMECKE